uniref:EGF-like domain-containing protein n=1 Tax=Romanomermis culicivorax TaxID=13658 RepID=A0A915J8R5_ROMCU
MKNTVSDYWNALDMVLWRCEFIRINPLYSRCNCSGSGYEGLHCEKDIDECNLALCHNQSTCENTPGSYKCNCLASFSGQHCDIPSIIPVGNSGQSHSEEEKTSTSSSHHDDGGGGVGGVVGGIIGGIAILCLTIGAFFLYKYISRSRKLKGKYNPAKEEMNNIGGHPVPLATLNTGERLI